MAARRRVDPKAVLFPETAAGGYSRVDGTVGFFTRVNALLRPDMVVLDFGAGRAAFLDEPPSYSRDLRLLRGKVAKVIGVDVDEAVHENESIDEAHVIGFNERLPLEDASVDLVLSDWVFEHVDDPAFVARELDRVLKPGGWICARTPNGRGFTALATRVIPNRHHAPLLSRLQPSRRARDVFPTRFKLNTRSQLREHFPPGRFTVYAYTHNPEPLYFGRSVLAWRAATTLGKVLPAAFGVSLMIFIQKADQPGPS